MTELNFWAAQCVNLESLFEQMQSNTTIKMASILFLTDSAYYPAFKLINFLILSYCSSGPCIAMWCQQ